jgi:uncharacterized protein with NAD-binding domain and iron-sulfur cluster
MNVAIVGGGWAGLSAAVELAGKAHHVAVFEASAALGGRARSVVAPHLGMAIDNGQHILLGAYSHTLALMNTLTGNAEERLLRLPLTVQSADGGFRLKAGRLPAPWHLLWAIAGARGMGVRDRFRLAMLCRNLKNDRRQAPEDWTVSRWLIQQRQTDTLMNGLWRPLCLAAMNTPIDQACARTFVRVLRDALLDAAPASNLLLPRTGLSDLWPNHLPDDIAVHCSHAVTRVAAENGSWRINGWDFDAVILACPPHAVARLLGPLVQGAPEPEERAGRANERAEKGRHAKKHEHEGKNGAKDEDKKEFLRTLDAFAYLPIATLTLRFATPWRLPCPMLMLAPDARRRHYGQWLFNLGGTVVGGTVVADTVATDTARACLATVVVSDARPLLGQPRDDIANAMIDQVKAQTRHMADMPALRGYELMTEKRATFAATPRLRRPGNESPWPGLWVAGDWTDTSYPAVLEGAVRSGQNAAIGLMRQFTQ